MNIITVSREFGSGGRELGKRIADILNYDYYDKEIISTIAEKKGLDESYVENLLEGKTLQRVTLTYGRSFTQAVSLAAHGTKLLSEQTSVIKSIAEKGKNCVIVGRNADVVLKEYKPFNIFACADLDARIKRCIERAEYGEQISEKEIEQNIKAIDKSRANARKIISETPWGDKKYYHLVVNTTDWKIKDLSFAVAEFAQSWFGRENR